MKKFRRWSKREWLNPVTSFDNGSVQVSVDADAWGAYGEFILRDCSRQVTISINPSNAKEFDSSIRKLAKLMDSIEELHGKMHIAYEYFKEAKVEEASKRKDRKKKNASEQSRDLRTDWT